MAGKLSSLQCKNAVIGKHSDGGGLYLHVTEVGKYWRASYRFDGKQKTASFGVYPEISLQEARAQHAQFKQTLKQGIDPNFKKKKTKALSKEAQQEADGTLPLLFSNVAHEWLETANTAKAWTTRHYQGMLSNLNHYLLPAFGRCRIDVITAPQIIAHLKSIPHAYTAGFTLENLKRIYGFAVNQQLIQASPVAFLKASELLPPHPSKPMRHSSDPITIGKILWEIERGIALEPAVKALLRLAPYLFMRPSELRLLTWEEWREEESMIVLPPERTKRRRLHHVPLPSQAQKLLQEMKPYTKRFAYVFANTKTGKPISDTAAKKYLERIGAHGLTTLHGLRHTASTFLNEQGFHKDHIEAQLSHADENSIRATYNKAQYLDQRRQMMQAYADYLDALKSQAQSKESQSALQDKP